MSKNNNLIETVDLTKIYKLKGKKKQIVALNKVNLSIKKGEVFGLLGPNGAGKTTIIQILTALKQPTSGRAFIDGYDIVKKPKQAKARIALMLESQMLYRRITAYANLKFYCKIYNVLNYQEKINKIVKDFGLEKWLYQLVENFSSGMKMKLALCRTLLLERPILFLDEPTVGLDVKNVSFIVDKLKDIDNTIFLTSHNMNVVEKLCDRIAILNKGEVIKIGTKEEISKLIQTTIKIEVEIHKNKNKLVVELNGQNFITSVSETKNGLIISLKNRKFYSDFLRILVNYDILKVKESELSLEQLFLEIINI